MTVFLQAIHSDVLTATWVGHLRIAQIKTALCTMWACGNVNAIKEHAAPIFTRLPRLVLFRSMNLLF